QKMSIPTFLLCPLGLTSANRGDQRDATELGITSRIKASSSSGPKNIFVCNILSKSIFEKSTEGGTGRLRCAYMPAISGVTSWIVTSRSDIKEKLSGCCFAYVITARISCGSMVFLNKIFPSLLRQ